MSATRLAFCLALIGLTACSKSSDSNKSPNPAEKPIEEILEYTEIRNLNVIHTNEDLKNMRTNSLSVKTVGKRTAYKIIYTFNSADSNSLKLIQSRLHSQYTNCTAPQMKLFLKGENVDQEITPLDQVPLEPQTNYKIEVLSTPECKDIEMTFDLVVWTGDKSIDPRTALVCNGPNTAQATFIMHLNNVTTFSSLEGKEEFLSSRSYCGERIKFTEGICSGSLNMEEKELGFAYKNVYCKSSNGNETKSFSIDFNASDRTATVNCKSNDLETHNEVFHTCQSVIVDSKPYKKLQTKFND